MGCERWFTVDVRVVAATNVNPSEQAAKGLFLPDLLARIEAGRTLPASRAGMTFRPCSPMPSADPVGVWARHAPSISDELLAAVLR
ncbi:MAG: sigma 54-interacting transcriptional regulator [Gemmatimonadetes bacterium]|nr:sigma 54-interacting transcriptional regulator [Gemmatimonadota bacterium]